MCVAIGWGSLIPSCLFLDILDRCYDFVKDPRVIASTGLIDLVYWQFHCDLAILDAGAVAARRVGAREALYVAQELMRVLILGFGLDSHVWPLIASHRNSACRRPNNLGRRR